MIKEDGVVLVVWSSYSRLSLGVLDATPCDNYIYNETYLNRTLSKPKTCLNKTHFIVPSTQCLYNLNLSKPNTCLNWTNSSIPNGFGLEMFYCCVGTVCIMSCHLYILQSVELWCGLHDPRVSLRVVSFLLLRKIWKYQRGNQKP